MTGANFHLIPNNAVGILAWSNSDPLTYLNSNDGKYLFDIVEKSETRMRVSQRVESTHGSKNFLGAIVSADRNVIYWVNNTEPLPAKSREESEQALSMD